jgi:L-lactate permease
VLILSLHLVGAGAGNMIALQNLAAVQATVGLKNAEREMLASLWLPCLAYGAVASVFGMIHYMLNSE